MSSTFPNLADAPTIVRSHSPQAVAAIKTWHSTYEKWQAVEGSPSELLNVLLVVAAESSYLGFPRTARLCRVLHMTMLKHASSCSGQSDQALALKSAWQGLAALVLNPRDESVDVIAIMQMMRLAFELSEGDVNQPIAGLMLQSEPTVSDTAPATEHRDMDVYLSARLDSLDRCLEEETWIVAQLAGLAEDLASGLQSQRPAQRLMRVLRSHKFFHQVDRVCLAGRVPNANQLMIVDACSSDRCHSNILKAGYSCFVNPEGSLFKLRPGTMRIFDDSDRVLGTFAQAGKPAQRSIALIEDMGLRSGLCLAIGRDTQLQGFLFLNSCQPQLFHDITVGFAPLISLLGLVATIALDSNGFHKSCEPFGRLDSGLPQTSKLFAVDEFTGYLNAAIVARVGHDARFKLKLSLPDKLAEFLYLPAQVAGTISELVLRLRLIQQEPTELTIGLQQSCAEMLFTLPHGSVRSNPKQWEWMRSQIDYLRIFLGNAPVQLLVDDQCVSVCVPFEPILQSHRDIRYSVVC